MAIIEPPKWLNYIVNSVMLAVQAILWIALIKNIFDDIKAEKYFLAFALVFTLSIIGYLYTKNPEDADIDIDPYFTKEDKKELKRLRKLMKKTGAE